MKRNFILFFLIIPILIFADLMWQENGIPIRQGTNIRNYRSVTLTDNSIINIWNDNRNGIKAIYGQILDLEGNPLWEDQGLLLQSSDTMQLIKDIIPTSDNGFIVLWQDFEMDDLQAFTNCVQKFNSNGEAVWGADGVELPGQNYYTILSDRLGGVYYCTNSSNEIITLYRLDSTGVAATGWESGISFEAENWSYSIDVTSDSNLIIAMRTGEATLNIYKMSSIGAQLWNSEGVSITSPAPATLIVSNVTTTSAGNSFITWKANDVENPGRLFVQYIDNMGEEIWAEPGSVQPGYNSSNYDFMLNTNSELVLCSWDEFRADIFKVDETGNQPWGDNGYSIIAYNVLSDIEKLDFNVTDDGEYQFVWSKKSGDYKKFYFQKCDEAGNLLFGPSGNMFHQCSFVGELPEVTFIENQPLLIWVEYIESDQFLKTQLLDVIGDEQWGVEGYDITMGIGGSSSKPELHISGETPVVLWMDSREYLSHDLYMQTLSSNGDTQQQPNGLKIFNDTEIGYGGYASVVGKNSNLITTLWLEQSENYYQMFFEQFDVQGNTSWGDSCEVAISDLQYQFENPKIYCKDNSGIDEYYCAWEKEYLYYDHVYSIIAQKVVNGAPIWGDGRTLASCDEYFSSPLELIDVVDRFVLWAEGDVYNTSVKVICLNESGYPMPGWPGNGLQIDSYTGSYTSIVTALTDAGLFITRRNTTDDGQRNLVGQIIDWSGNLLWEPEGKILVSDIGSSDFSVSVDDDIILTWMQFSMDFATPVKMQKFDFNGEEIWEEGGITIYEGNYNYGISSALTTIDDKILTIFEYKEIEASYTNLKAQVIDEDGELLYPENGITIVEEYVRQQSPQIQIVDDSAYIIWNDYRSTYYEEQFGNYQNIYAQKLDLTNLASPEDVVKPNSVNLSNYPNPFNPTTTISFSLNTESTEDTELEIFNVKGQKIKSFLIPPSPLSPTTSITWNGTDNQNIPVSSGVYFINLKSGDRNLSQKKCVLLK